jgi:hypothetical protein
LSAELPASRELVSMHHPLQQRVDTVRRGARRAVWLHALGWFSAAVLATALAIGTLDFLVRPLDHGLRWLLSLLLLAVAAAAARRWLLPAWRYHPSRLETAQRIERAFPELGGRLASSIEFLDQAEGDHTAGSFALRRRVVAEAEAIASRLDYAAVLNRRPPRQGLLMFAAVGSVLAIVLVVNPARALLATARITMPWSAVAWPRWNHLQFVAPAARLVRGGDVELAVVDANDRLPESVVLQIRYNDGETLQSDMKFLAGRMVYRLENVARGFEYRASGGDDDTMAWLQLEVVEPLKVTELKAIVHPPRYAGQPWQATGNVLTTVEGSVIALSGQVDQPLHSASVARLATNEAVPLEILPEGSSFRLTADSAQPWALEKPGVYVLRLTSSEGVVTENAFQWEIRLTADAPPSVAMRLPGDGEFATPQAQLPVEGVAKDDLALAAIELRFLCPEGSDQEASRVPVWQAEQNPLLVESAAQRVTGGQTESFQATWDLQAVAGLQSGDVLSWYVEASDFKPQAGRSTAARLTIISPEEMQQRLMQRQALALAQLAEAFNLQRETRMQIGNLQVQWQEIGEWRPRDRDLLQSAELHQRRVKDLIGRTPTGAATILNGLLADVRSNRLELPDMVTRSEEILTALDQLERVPLAKVETHFASLLRESRQEAPAAEATQSELTALEGQQEVVSAALEELLGKLNEWDSFQRIRRDLAGIRDEEQSLIVGTQKLQAEAIVGGAPSQHAADARQLSRQQVELARRVEKLQQRLQEFAHREGSESSSAAKAAEMAETAGRLGIAVQMRDAAAAADGMKLGQALAAQQQAEASLAELLDALSGRSENDPAKSLQELRDLASILAALAEQQAALADELADQSSSADEESLQKFSEQQQAIEKKARELADKLQPRAGDAAQSAQDAAAAMQQAAAAAQQKNASQAAEQARQAERKLQQASQQVNQQIAQRQADLLREQMARLEQHIHGLLVRQEAARQETARLLDLKERQGELSAAQATSLGDLSLEQEVLSQETRALGSGGALPAAFNAQLEWTADDMQSVALQLRELALATDLIAQQHKILDRLQMLLTALQPDPPAAGDENEPPMGEPPPMPPPPDGARPPDVHDVAEVKLLRIMQAAINEQTAQLESQRDAAGNLPGKVQRQLEALAEEQGKVAELALKLVQSLSRPKRPAAGEPADDAPNVSDEELLRQLDEALLPGE